MGRVNLYEARFRYVWLGFERIVEVDGAVGGTGEDLGGLES